MHQEIDYVLRTNEKRRDGLSHLLQLWVLANADAQTFFQQARGNRTTGELQN
jgi:hypothetical protein